MFARIPTCCLVVCVRFLSDFLICERGVYTLLGMCTAEDKKKSCRLGRKIDLNKLPTWVIRVERGNL